MTIPFTESVRNDTEFSLWEKLDVKGAAVAVPLFSDLDSDYERTPQKFINRIIIQTNSDPMRIRIYDDEANFIEDAYHPSADGNDERLKYTQVTAVNGLKDPSTDGDITTKMEELKGDVAAQANYLSSCYAEAALHNGKLTYEAKLILADDFYGFCPEESGLLSWVKNEESVEAVCFKFIGVTGSFYKATLNISGDLDFWRRIDGEIIQSREIQLVRDTASEKPDPTRIFKDSNNWTQTEFTNSWVIWHVGSDGNKTRILTMKSSGFNVEVPIRQDGVEVATIDDLPVVYIGDEAGVIKSISTGDGLTWVYNAGTKDLELSSDGTTGDTDWQLRNKVSYDNSTTNTTSTGQGTVYEFLGAGSTGATHNHEFDDSGVAWVANFQVTSQRDKTINVGTSVGSVGITSYKLPVNMIVKFSYAKDTNKMYSEASYIRPELIDYASDTKVVEIVDERLTAITNPQTGTTFQKLVTTPDDGYLSTYTNVKYQLGRIEELQFNDDQCIGEFVRYSDSDEGYLLISEDNLGKYIGRNVDKGDLEFGFSFTEDAKLRLGQYSAELPVNHVLGAKWSWDYKAIPNLIPTEPDGTSDGTLNNANDPTLWLKSNGATTTDSSEALQVGYTKVKGETVDVFEDRVWRHAIKRGYVNNDKSFTFDSSSKIFVTPIKCNTISLSKCHTISITNGYIALYPTPYDAMFYQNGFVRQNNYDAKSGYSKVSSGGGSTHKIEYWENGTIFKLSNSKIEVRLLEGMHDKDGQRHGYVKYINNRGSDVAFEWYNRNGTKISNSTIPSICPADTVVEIFANYSTDDYFINVSQSKVIASASQTADLKLFKMAVESQNKYGTQLVVDFTGGN